MVKIEVKQEHIDEGTEQSCFSCPIALAIADLLKEDFYARVFSLIEIRRERNHEILYSDKASSEMNEFMNMFDRGYPVKPFSFELDIPTELLKGSSNDS